MDPEAIEFIKDYNWPGNIRELENLVQRLAALYGEDVISLENVSNELSPTPTTDIQSNENKENIFADETLQQSIYRHLRKYFDAHPGGDLPPNGLYTRILNELEIPLIELSLRATRGNQIKAAELLGLNRNTLRKKIKELEIKIIKDRF